MENKRKRGERINILRGKNHWNWQGGISPQRSLEYAKPEYKNFVKSILKRDDYTCQKCGIKNGYGKKINLEVHHIKSYAEYPELRFAINNGITLCKKCHNETKKGKPRPNRIDKKFIKKICIKCGKEFSKRNPRKFCEECQKIECVYCKNKFIPKNKRYLSKFCSRKCYFKWFSENKKGENNPNYKNKIKKICLICNKNYFIKPSLKQTSKFCSLKCRNKWQSEVMKGNDFRKK